MSPSYRAAPADATLALVHALAGLSGLQLVFGLLQGRGPLRFVLRHGMIFLQQKAEVKPLAYLKIYDVRAAVFKAPVFVAPQLGLRPLDSEGGFVGGTTGDSKPIHGYDADRLVELIQRHVEPEAWGKAGVSIESQNGILFVRQTVRGQEGVRKLLVKLGVIAAPRPAKKRPLRSVRRTAAPRPRRR